MVPRFTRCRVQVAWWVAVPPGFANVCENGVQSPVISTRDPCRRAVVSAASASGADDTGVTAAAARTARPVPAIGDGRPYAARARAMTAVPALKRILFTARENNRTETHTLQFGQASINSNES